MAPRGSNVCCTQCGKPFDIEPDCCDVCGCQGFTFKTDYPFSRQRAEAGHHLTPFDAANLLAGHAVSYATSFLDGRHGAEQV